MSNTNKKIPDFQNDESPEDSAAWEAALNSIDGQELMAFLMAEAEDELAQGKFTEDFIEETKPKTK